MRERQLYPLQCLSFPLKLIALQQLETLLLFIHFSMVQNSFAEFTQCISTCHTFQLASSKPSLFNKIEMYFLTG